MSNILRMAVILVAFLPLHTFADLGPKPTMNFTFTSLPEGVTVMDSQLLQCKDRFCLSAAPLEDLGPQAFGCSNTGCRAVAYGFSDYNKLVVNFSDATRRSNIFQKADELNSAYTVEVGADMTVTLTESTSNNFFIAFAISIFVELLVGLAYVRIRKESWLILLAIAVANILTVPVFWMMYTTLISQMTHYVFTEIAIIIIESTIIKLIVRSSLSWKSALLIGLVINLASVLVGEVLALI